MIQQALDLIKAMEIMFRKGVINPRGGNGSVKVDEDRILITPSGLPKYRLTPRDLVLYDMKSGIYVGVWKPSIEVKVHETIYRSTDAKAVLHAHPVYTNILVELGYRDWWSSPLVESEFKQNEVCLTGSYKPGSLELTHGLKSCLEAGASVIIVTQHGVFTWGSDVWLALDKILALEYLAKKHYLTLMIKH